jgi:hypothetical protein
MQNKLIVLLLLAKCTSAQDKSAAPKMGDLPKGAAEAVPEVSKDLKTAMKPANLETMVIPPPKNSHDAKMALTKGTAAPSASSGK